MLETVLAVIQKIPAMRARMAGSAVGNRHSEDAWPCWVASVDLNRSFDKLDDFTPLKRKSVLRGESARRGEGRSRADDRPAAGLP